MKYLPIRVRMFCTGWSGSDRGVQREGASDASEHLTRWWRPARMRSMASADLSAAGGQLEPQRLGQDGGAAADGAAGAAKGAEARVGPDGAEAAHAAAAALPGAERDARADSGCAARDPGMIGVQPPAQPAREPEPAPGFAAGPAAAVAARTLEAASQPVGFAAAQGAAPAKAPPSARVPTGGPAEEEEPLRDALAPLVAGLRRTGRLPAALAAFRDAAAAEVKQAVRCRPQPARCARAQTASLDASGAGFRTAARTDPLPRCGWVPVLRARECTGQPQPTTSVQVSRGSPRLCASWPPYTLVSIHGCTTREARSERLRSSLRGACAAQGPGGAGGAGAAGRGGGHARGAPGRQAAGAPPWCTGCGEASQPCARSRPQVKAPRRCASTVRLSDARPAPQALRPDDFAALLGAALAAARAALAHAADVRALVGAALRARGAGRAEAAAAAAAGDAAVQAVADAASGRWSKLVGARCATHPTPHQ